MDTKYRILSVDDDTDILKFIEMVLSDKYEVVTSSLGKEALIKCKECEPDLVILDVMMPDMSGFEICHEIRKMTATKNLPIIMLSGLDNPQDHKSGYKEGASYYMTKPVTPERLLRNVELQLESSGPPRAKKLSLEQIKSRKSWQDQEPKAAAKSKPSSTAPVTKPVSKEIRRPRILMVDDDPDILRMLELIFQNEYELVTSNNGMDALRKATSYDPDVLILDVMIPKINGFQVCSAVRKLDRLAGLPIIFLTGKDDPKLKELSRQLNAVYLMKPVEAHVLTKEVKQAVDRSPYLNQTKRVSFAEIQAMESLDGISRNNKAHRNSFQD
jgi:DNA-binding response OmpR family regulator